MFAKPGLFSLIVLVVMSFLSGCTTAQLPADDKTPPEVVWIIKHSQGGEERFTPAKCNPKCPIVKQQAGETLDIRFFVSEDGGVREITLGSGSDNGLAGMYVCLQDGVTHGESLILSPNQDKKTLSPNNQNNILTAESLSRPVGLNMGATCTSGSTFVEGNLTLVGTAENYFQGKVTSKLTICSPECKVLTPP